MLFACSEALGGGGGGVARNNGDSDDNLLSGLPGGGLLFLHSLKAIYPMSGTPFIDVSGLSKAPIPDVYNGGPGGELSPSLPSLSC